jgi:glycosyltransferase involved in cell wall biosynthesis
MFRMMQSAQRAGFANTLLFYNRHDADLGEYADVVRSAWPWLDCEIGEIGDRIEGFDAVVASSWATAHALAAHAGAVMRPLYFIQDYEPYFYPRGSQYAFAEDTYRFGFRNIALGHMVQQCLEREAGVASDFVPFGCDTGTYRLLDADRPRSGIVVYAKKGNDRRGYRLVILALEIFHRRFPHEPVHVYGDRVDELSFPVVQHGSVRPDELNELYNGVVAGLALSFTNISLVAEELLAAGAIPVINDSPLARADLENPHARWATPTPAALADALGAAVANPDRQAAALAAARSVEGRSWDPTGEAVARILADEPSR